MGISARVRVLAVALLAAAVAGAAAAPATLDLSSVTSWAATPLVTDPARFAEVRGTKCGKGVCAFENAVCCEASGTCCEWGTCSEGGIDGATQCTASKEQNALLLAKAFAKDEAAKEVKHEQHMKTHSEQGEKLLKESQEKNVQEQAEKKEATAEEAQAKKDATAAHEAKLAAQEAGEERSKTKEAAAKKRAQAAMVNRFKISKAVTFNAARPFDARTNKCWANAATGSAFTINAWVYMKEDSTSDKVRNVLSASSVQLYSRYRKGQQRLGITVLHPSKGKTKLYESRTALPVHRWSHISVVVTAKLTQVFLNGKSVIRKRNLPGFLVAGPDNRVCAGLAPVLDERIADLQFVNTAQTASARAAHRAAKRYDDVKDSIAVTTIVDGPWSPSANKLLGKNNMQHSGAYSTGLWLRSTGMAATETNIWHKGDSNGGTSMWLNLLPKGDFGELQIRSGRGQFVTYKIPNDKWFHFLWTHGGNKLNVFVNGKRVSSTKYPNARSIAAMPLYASNPWSRQTPAAPIIAANFVFASKVLDNRAIREIIAKVYDHAYIPEGKQLVKVADVAKQTLRVAAKEIDDATCRTWAVWVRPGAALAGWRSLFHKGTGTSQRAPAFWFKPGSTKLHFRSGTRALPNYGIDFDEDLPVGVWTHVAAVHCNRKLQLFINAQKKGEDLKAVAPDTNDGDLYIPKTEYGRASATLADIRYWTLALNDKMIHHLFEKAAHP